jgi:hypothetical protein
MGPADGVVIPAEVPEPSVEDQLQGQGAVLLSPPFSAGDGLTQKPDAAVFEDRRLN